MRHSVIGDGKSLFFRQPFLQPADDLAERLNPFLFNTLFHESVTSHQKTKTPITTSTPRTISSIFLTRNTS